MFSLWRRHTTVLRSFARCPFGALVVPRPGSTLAQFGASGLLTLPTKIFKDDPLELGGIPLTLGNHG